MSSLPFDPNRDVYNLREKSLEEIFFELNNEQGQATPHSLIQLKSHVRYLKDYLGPDGLSAQYIVAERYYINKDYLTDYSLYYSSCFSVYSKLCIRVHLFSFEVEPEVFRSRFKDLIIEGFGLENNKEFVSKYYLGYIVIKPTPNYFIGFTLLRHLNFNEGMKSHCARSKYFGVKDYPVHIYGNKFIIESLAFQEQDKNVAACATIAIWSMFQRAAEDYYVVLRSPIQITYDTGITSHDGNRLIPNRGLSIRQMADAITKNNLVTEAIDFETHKDVPSFNSYIKRLIYAYAPIQIPLILAVEFPPYDETQVGHAVSIVGYHMDDIESVPQKKFLGKVLDALRVEPIIPEILWTADRINKIYVHDDQWGPFAPMVLEGERMIRSLWDNINLSGQPCKTQSILISLYPKIRISYDYIESKVKLLNGIIKKVFFNDLYWNIQLYLSESYKSIIQTATFGYYEHSKKQQIKFDFLTRNFPKYIWVVSLINEKNDSIYDFIYDATGLSSGNLIHTIVGYSPGAIDILIQIFKKEVNKIPQLFNHDVQSYIEAIIS